MTTASMTATTSTVASHGYSPANSLHAATIPAARILGNYTSTAPNHDTRQAPRFTRSNDYAAHTRAAHGHQRVIDELRSAIVSTSGAAEAMPPPAPRVAFRFAFSTDRPGQRLIADRIEEELDRDPAVQSMAGTTRNALVKRVTADLTQALEDARNRGNAAETFKPFQTRLYYAVSAGVDPSANQAARQLRNAEFRLQPACDNFVLHNLVADFTSAHIPRSEEPRIVRLPYDFAVKRSWI